MSFLGRIPCKFTGCFIQVAIYNPFDILGKMALSVYHGHVSHFSRADTLRSWWVGVWAMEGHVMIGKDEVGSYWVTWFVGHPQIGLLRYEPFWSTDTHLEGDWDMLCS